MFGFNQKKNLDKYRLDSFEKKYKKQWDIVSSKFDNSAELKDLFYDLINARLVNLICIDNKLDVIPEADKIEDLLNKSKNPKIIEFNLSKRYVKECADIYFELMQLWEKAIDKHTKKETEKELQFYLDSLLDASILFESMFSELSSKNIIKDEKTSELLQHIEKLNTDLSKILDECKSKYFEV